jgi:hypothetical protein
MILCPRPDTLRGKVVPVRAHYRCTAPGRRKYVSVGYIIDHNTPPCEGGDDNLHNMQSQTSEAGKATSRIEGQRRSRRR